jgi:hypothetical protein
VTRDQDLQHLKILSILHYVAGGLVGFFSCFLFIHLTIGITMIAAPKIWATGGGAPPPAFVGWFFTIISGTILLICWSLAICILLAGRFLARHKHYLFCMIVAGVGCCWVPLGTVLGVFTIIVLQRPSVKELFQTSDVMIPRAEHPSG